MYRRFSPLSCGFIASVVLGCADPIDLEDSSGGTSTASTTSTSDTEGRPGPSGPRPSMTTGGNATTGAWKTGWDDTGWYTSVGGGYTDGWSTFGDTFGDDWGTWGLGPCWMFDEAGCLDAAAQGFNCAWLPEYDLDSDVSCAWELIGYACLDLESPPAPGCVAPSSCANGAGTFQVGGPFDSVVPYNGCTQLVDHATCVPGSPSPNCACACINPPPS
jgi:hypothetical protein